MDVKWELPRLCGRAAALSGPGRLEIADLMNYVYERDYAVLVRLKVPAGRTWHESDPRGGALARLHRQDLRARTGRAGARPAGRQWHSAACAIRCLASGASTALGERGPFCGRRDKLRVAIPLPASVDVGTPYLFPITDGPVDYEGKQAFRRSGDTLVAELPRKET
jgi:hypothetical protein